MLIILSTNHIDAEGADLSRFKYRTTFMIYRPTFTIYHPSFMFYRPTFTIYRKFTLQTKKIAPVL